jgi:hypothetical protein
MTSENVLPPVDMPLQLVSHRQWDLGATPNLTLSPRHANQVIVVQTDSEQCHSTATCSQLLLKLQVCRHYFAQAPFLDTYLLLLYSCC